MKKKKRLSVLTLLFVLSFCMTACGSDGVKSESMTDMSTGNSGGDLYYENSYDDVWESETATDSSASSVASNRKLIKTVDLTAETYEFNKLVNTVEAKVTALGGYMENSSVHTGYDNLQYGNFVIRIPVKNLDSFVTEVSEISNITDKDSSQKDVTLSYVDLESHKNALEAEETSLLRLLENAVSIDDIITLQSRLTDVRYQIESMESQLRTMDNLIDYGTINLYVEEVKTYTPVKELTMGERMKAGFNDSLEDIGNGFKNLLIFLVINSPFLLIWAVVIAVSIIVVRLIIKSAIKKGNEAAKKRELDMQRAMQQPPMMGNVNMMPQNNIMQNGKNNGQ